jgi:hypothetical protein
MDNATAQEKAAEQVLRLFGNFKFKRSAYRNKIFYSPTNAQVMVLTTILKFTLK